MSCVAGSPVCDDVAKGSRWSAEVAKELEASRVGLLIITPSNQEAPWLVFEAGALSKSIDRSKVCPLLFGAMEPTDLKGPLVQFQSAQFGKDEIRRVAKMINGELGEAALSADVLDSVFEMWWPKLEQAVAKAITDISDQGEGERRSEREMIEEVLALSRRLSNDRERRHEFDHPAWDDLLRSIFELAHITQDYPEAAHAIDRLMRPLEHLVLTGRKGRTNHRILMELDHLREMRRPRPVVSEPSTTA